MHVCMCVHRINGGLENGAEQTYLPDDSSVEDILTPSVPITRFYVL